MELVLKLVGQRPMLQHNGRLANPLDRMIEAARVRCLDEIKPARQGSAGLGSARLGVAGLGTAPQGAPRRGKAGMPA